jgi:hypothetical protein
VVVPNPIENPSAGGGGGDLQVAIFSMTHVSGTFSTGPLGFTPKFAIYSGVAITTVVGVNHHGHAVGFVIGPGGSARAAGVFLRSISGTDVTGALASGDDDAIGGLDNTFGNSGPFFDTSFPIDLDVTAFGPGGIDLTWSAAVTDHAGKLIVVGETSGGAGGSIIAHELLQFGRDGVVPDAGTLQLYAAGNTLQGTEIIRAGIITGLSIKTNVGDAARSYSLQARVNGVVGAAVLAFPAGGGNEQSTGALAVAVAPGDFVQLFLVKRPQARVIRHSLRSKRSWSLARRLRFRAEVAAGRGRTGQ